ncbi:hypothetical protein CORC01_09241 [Colletotrichum orchidophilum]|uniref:Uncharacterized protein n=1 Tax=Colletotrichum orchidophilum TaxID=1209926 RepID=A0A1G4B258_9PEZI|nr:uncharacterized protein CORC01_09241 [Colletotrichum orchidophilum]OHE95508.1 hypothetical protein CORC01_09241 [Colletotrichum orchidophilum]
MTLTNDDVSNKVRALPDLRSQPPHLADAQISRLWHGPRSTEKQTTKSCRGLDVVLIVLRHLFSIVPESRNVNTADNPILELAWKDIEDERYKSQSAELKSEVVETIAARIGVQDPSFADICESHFLQDTLWSLQNYLLCGPPEFRTDSGRWAPEEVPNAHFLASRSLVTWSGKEDLVDCLAKIWRNYLFRDGTVHHLTAEKYAPSIIRALYHPRGDFPRQEKDLINFDWPNFQHYTLVAAVWLRGTHDDATSHLDFVRLYSALQADVLPQLSSKYRATTPEDLGQPGRSYMLFYGARAASAFPKSYARCLLDQKDRMIKQALENHPLVLSTAHWDAPAQGSNIPAVHLVGHLDSNLRPFAETGTSIQMAALQQAQDATAQTPALQEAQGSTAQTPALQPTGRTAHILNPQAGLGITTPVDMSGNDWDFTSPPFIPNYASNMPKHHTQHSDHAYRGGWRLGGTGRERGNRNDPHPLSNPNLMPVAARGGSGHYLGSHRHSFGHGRANNGNENDPMHQTSRHHGTFSPFDGPYNDGRNGSGSGQGNSSGRGRGGGLQFRYFGGREPPRR